MQYRCATCGRDLTDEEIGDSYYEKTRRGGIEVKVKKFRGHEDHVIFRSGPPSVTTSSTKKK